MQAEEDSQHVWDAVVDAHSGKLLYRRNLVLNVAALAFDNYPGAPAGRLAGGEGLPGRMAQLREHACRATTRTSTADVNDDDSRRAGERDPPRRGGTYNYVTHFQAPPTRRRPGLPAGRLLLQQLRQDGSPTSSRWTVNRSQAGTQLFYYVNRFHDHLRDAPGIGFNAASGGFEGGDRLHRRGRERRRARSAPFTACPTAAYLNNADMTTLPDGVPPRMQMYLWSSACTGASVVINDVDGANDAFIVYHEYAHGLSSRLVTDAAGVGALAGLAVRRDGRGAGAIGTRSTSWWPQGLEVDTAAPGELRTGQYEAEPVRTQPFDCPVGGGPPSCPGTPLRRPGRLHLRRLRARGPGQRPGGARRRRDLGRRRCGTCAGRSSPRTATRPA